LSLRRTRLQAGIRRIKPRQHLPWFDSRTGIHQTLDDLPADAKTQLYLVARANLAAVNIAATGYDSTDDLGQCRLLDSG